jgi:hypothetical protein
VRIGKPERRGIRKGLVHISIRVSRDFLRLVLGVDDGERPIRRTEPDDVPVRSSSPYFSADRRPPLRATRCGSTFADCRRVPP